MKRLEGIPGAFTLDDLIAAARAEPRDEVGDDEIRSALKLELLPLECPGYRVVDEFGVCDGSARVDVAAIGPTELVGYEIKSELDSLRRLTRQQELFGSVFDRVTLVVAAAHRKRAESLVPGWWGLIEIRKGSRRVALERVRDATPNAQPSIVAKLDLLWLNELTQLALGAGMQTRGIRKAEMIDRLSDGCDGQSLRLAVTTYLLSRARWKPALRRT